MIIHKLLLRYFTHGDDREFYLMQAQDAAAWLERAGVRLGPGTEAVDLGCGHGVFGAELKKRGWQVTFADQENHLLAERAGERFAQIDLDRDDYSKLGQFDLVVCSNVFEHLAKPERFLAEISKLLRPEGKLYLSWTNWWSPFGGHDFAPFHYLGPRLGRWVHHKLTGRWSDHVPFAGLYPTYIGRTLRQVRTSPDLRILKMATRYYPEFSLVLRLPLAREVLAWNCALLVGRREAPKKSAASL